MITREYRPSATQGAHACPIQAMSLFTLPILQTLHRFPVAGTTLRELRMTGGARGSAKESCFRNTLQRRILTCVGHIASSKIQSAHGTAFLSCLEACRNSTPRISRLGGQGMIPRRAGHSATSKYPFSRAIPALRVLRPSTAKTHNSSRLAS